MVSLRERILEARYRAVSRRMNSYSQTTREAFKPVYRMEKIVRLIEII
jgi:hypothetical protein